MTSGTLKRIATTLSKICNDLRLLASGPRGGLSEISLPPLQAGSSIMPGKVNPVVPEVVNQVAFRVIGSDMAVTLAAEGGQLQLNVMEPLIVFSLLESMALLSNAVTTLTVKCVADIAADAQNCARHLERSMAGATALTPCVGYERAARLAKEALASGSTLSEVVSAQPDLPQDVIRQILDLRRLTEAVRLEDGSKARYSTMK
ncbi:aspartate ammonia-lyase [Castellaniella caeni]